MTLTHFQVVTPAGRMRLCDKQPSDQPIPTDYRAFRNLCPGCKEAQRDWRKYGRESWEKK